jgi:hypothetical protein
MEKLMKCSLVGILQSVGMCLVLICQSSFGQSIPVPEYYGVYVVVDGQLVKLDGTSVHAPRNVTVRFGQRNSVGNIVNRQPAALSPASVQIPSFPGDLKIIIYQETSGAESPLDIAKSLHLVPLVFVKTLNVDTGFPSNIRRSDAENGWDDGDPAEMVMVNGGDHPQNLELLVKPMPGQKDMVVAGLQEKLTPGVYRLSKGEADPMAAMMGGGKGLAFAVEPVLQGELGKCVNESLTYMMTMSKTKYTSCSGGPASASADASVPPGGDASGAAAGCSDYGSCFKGGLNAWQASNWEEAIGDFRAAVAKDPTKGDGWTWLGRAYLAAGRTNDFAAAWDKAVSLGFPLILGVCHEMGFMRGNCERDNLVISVKQISLGQERQPPLFSVSPELVAPKGVMNMPGQPASYFRIGIDKKNYNLDFVPFGITCQTNLVQVQCPQDGVAQQIAVGNYVIQVIPKIASGGLGKSN